MIDPSYISTMKLQALMCDLQNLIDPSGILCYDKGNDIDIGVLRYMTAMSPKIEHLNPCLLEFFGRINPACVKGAILSISKR